MEFEEKKESTAGASPKVKRPSAEEMRQFYEKWSGYAKSKEVALRRLKQDEKTITRIESIYSKETLRTLMKKPLANYKRLRELSRFLYYRSMVYRRLIHFNANMIDTNYYSIIPMIDFNKSYNPETVKKDYFEVAKYLSKMNLPLEFLKVYIVCWREDTFYGVSYADDDGSFFILPLNPDFCSVIGQYTDGNLAFSMNMTFFDTNSELAELWGEPFTSMYKAYLNDRTNGKWQEVPIEYSVCLKMNIDEWEYPIPPYVNLFNSLINLEDLNEIMAVADEEKIYKMIALKMPLLKGSNKPNDFAVDEDVAELYYEEMADKLPDYANAALLPGLEHDVISFDRNASTDVSEVEKATKALLNTSGGAQILNSATVSNSVAWNGAIRSDEDYALSSLLPQTQNWINRHIDLKLGKPVKVKMLEVTKYTRDSFKDSIRQDATYGVPTKFMINTLNGFNPYETMCLNIFEEDIMHLSEVFVPLQNSHSMDTGSIGSGTKEILPDTEITDAGERSRDYK